MTDNDKRDYTEWDPYENRDTLIEMRKIKVVKTRTPHECSLGKHTIPIGSMARYESAMYDWEWGSFYVCCACIDKKTASE